jgi:hypothetical protein
MRRQSRALLATSVAIAAIVLGGMTAAQASPGDLATPAGTGVGSVVIFIPGPGIAPGTVLPQGMILTPVPATGSLVLPVRVPPVSGTGPSLARYVLLIPGPNPSQNTGVALGLQLAVSIGTTGVVTVYPVPAP